MSTTELQLAPIFLPRPPPSLRPPAFSLPAELLFTILGLATTNTDYDYSSSWKHQQTRVAFSGVCRAWNHVAASQSTLVVDGAGMSASTRQCDSGEARHATRRQVAASDHRRLPHRLHAQTRGLRARRWVCRNHEACPRVDYVELDVEGDLELDQSLLSGLEGCNLSKFDISGSCAMPEKALYR